MSESQQTSPNDGIERRVPSFQTFIRNVPSNPGKALPPDPPATSPHSTSLRRSSSLYTRATGIWDAEKSWYDDTVTHTRARSERRSSSSGSPLSAVRSPLTPFAPEEYSNLTLLEPRRYEPLLPSPSPSLAPTSGKNSNFPHLPNQSFRPGEYPTDNDFKYSPLPAPSPISLDFAKSSNVPSPLSVTSPQARSPPGPPSPIRLSSRLSRPFNPAVTTRRDGSMKKALAALGVTAEEAGVVSGSQKGDKVTPKSLTFTHDMPEAKHPLLRQAKRTKSKGKSERKSGNKISDSENVEGLSPDYHQALVNQYRELAAPIQGQWEDSSDDEDRGRDLRLVPAPLFWANRQKELYPNRFEHFLSSGKQSTKPQETASMWERRGKKGQSESVLGAPLKLTLASQLKGRDGEAKREASLGQRVSPRSLFRARNQSASKASPLKKDAFQTGGARDDKKDVRSEPPLPLQLPTIVSYGRPRDESHASNGGRSHPSAADYNARPSWSRDSSPGLRNERTSHLRTPTFNHGGSVESYAASHHSASADECEHPGSSITSTRLDDLPKMVQPSLTPSKAKGLANMSIHSVMHKARSSLQVKKGHSRTRSSNSTKSQEATVQSDSIGVPYADVVAAEDVQAGSYSRQEQERRASSKPGFMGKSLTGKKEREREKRRQDLKASIKFVGQTDPNDVEVAEPERDRSRRDTFGGDWV